MSLGDGVTVIRRIFLVQVGCSRGSVLEAGPRLVGTNEMHSIDLVPVSTVCWGVGIGGRGSDIVSYISQIRYALTPRELT